MLVIICCFAPLSDNLQHSWVCVAVKTCSNLPTESIPQYSEGWNKSCKAAPVGTECRASCQVNATTAVTSVCSMNGDNAVWSTPTGTCACKYKSNLSVGGVCALDSSGHNSCDISSYVFTEQILSLLVWDSRNCSPICSSTISINMLLDKGNLQLHCVLLKPVLMCCVFPAAPYKACQGYPTILTAPYAVAWNPTCTGAAHGTICFAGCTEFGVGAGWVATCNNGTWDLSSGCVGKLISTITKLHLV